MSKLPVLAIGAVVFLCGAGAMADSGSSCPFYRNPITIKLPDGSLMTNCADPTVQQGNDGYWYAVCTTDSLSDGDVDANGNRNMHLMPTIRTRDFETWSYVGDAFTTRPAWAAPTAGLWAPEVVRRNGQYYLYYVVTDVVDEVSGVPNCGGDSAIGVATASSLAGPWVDSGAPVVAPRRNGGGCDFFWTYDPEVLVTSTGRAVLYYGSYYGGIEARELSLDGLSAAPETAKAITIANRYEGANVVEKDGAYWLLASASNCCNGPLTGYQVFAGRADDPFGPFVDSEGVSLLATRTGGSPVITTNGNRWVGTGHQSIFQDANGDWYAAYHAIDSGDPYFEGSVGYTRRPLLIDRLSWTNDGFPQLRDGLGASDGIALAPAARRSSRRELQTRHEVDRLLTLVDERAWLRKLDAIDPTTLPLDEAASDEFDGVALGAKWSWVRPPANADYDVQNGIFRFATQAADVNGGNNTASLLTEAAPAGDWIAEISVDLDVPDEGCCFNYVQAGLLAYGNDDAYIKLAHVSIWETRQIEFGKEIANPQPGYPAYGSSVGAPPGRNTWLRIAKVVRNGVANYVSYSSHDGDVFTRGGTWTHDLGDSEKLAIGAFGGSGFNARFDYIRVHPLPAR